MPRDDESLSTKRDRIVQELRRRILTGEYPRGSRLRQDELAANFGVSITPIREALRLLESERLVVGEPHKGVRVAGMDPDRLAGIYVLRRLAESFAMRRAVHRLSRLDLTELRGMLEEMEARAGDPEFDARAANRKFHFAFYERCGLPELTRQIATMWDAFPWDLLLGDEGRVAASVLEHRAIFEAAERNDADGAAEATGRHIAGSLVALRAKLTGVPGSDPFDVD